MEMRMSGTLRSWVPYTAHYPCLLLGALGTQVLRLCERGMELASAIQFQIYEAASGCYRRLPPWGSSLMGALLALLLSGLAGHAMPSVLEPFRDCTSILWHNFFALATRRQYHPAILCQCVSRGWIWRERVNYISIYAGSRGKAVAQLWSGCVIQQDRPFHVTALCWFGTPERKVEGFILWEIDSWESWGPHFLLIRMGGLLSRAAEK